MNDKYIILVGDGMADLPLDRLEGRTPLEAAETPNMNRLALIGRQGTVQTIPAGMEPGSDVANMSLLGYDPAVYHTGRAPLEAASMGVELAPDEVAFRCNLVFLENQASGTIVMGDYSAGHISTGEATVLIAALQDAVSGSPLSLYPGVGYRHLLVWKGGPTELPTTPPHDIIGRPIAPYDVISREPVLQSFVERAARILENHPLTRQRRNAGRNPANAVWLWGQGKAPSMPKLRARFGISGAMISAVDLLKGIGVYAGLEAVNVEGATGYLDTNYAGKVAAAISALQKEDFVFVHLEAPDEASHEGSLEKKIEAIEKFDERIVGPMVERALQFEHVHLMIAPDHLTPISLRTHAADPVPFLLVDKLDFIGNSGGAATGFCERNAKESGWHFSSGTSLFERFMGMLTAESPARAKPV